MNDTSTTRLLNNNNDNDNDNDNDNERTYDSTINSTINNFNNTISNSIATAIEISSNEFNEISDIDISGDELSDIEISDIEISDIEYGNKTISETGHVNISNILSNNTCIICLMPSTSEHEVIDLNDVNVKHKRKSCKCLSYVHPKCIITWYNLKPKCIICHKKLTFLKSHNVNQSTSSSPIQSIISVQQHRSNQSAWTHTRNTICACNIIVIVFCCIIFELNYNN